VAAEQLVDDLVLLMRVLARATQPREQMGLTQEQVWLLRLLAQRGPLRVGEIAAALRLKSSSVTLATQRLAKAGLVRREREVEDERGVRVALTTAGLRALQQWRRLRLGILSQLLSALTPEEQATFQGLVERLLDAASDLSLEGQPAARRALPGGDDIASAPNSAVDAVPRNGEAAD
jgi:DNA-binding MarR family transcriptional regulator